MEVHNLLLTQAAMYKLDTSNIKLKKTKIPFHIQLVFGTQKNSSLDKYSFLQKVIQCITALLQQENNQNPFSKAHALLHQCHQQASLSCSTASLTMIYLSFQGEFCHPFRKIHGYLRKLCP